MRARPRRTATPIGEGWQNGLCPASGRGPGKAASIWRADAPVTEIGGLGRRQLDDPLMFR